MVELILDNAITDIKSSRQNVTNKQILVSFQLYVILHIMLYIFRQV